MYDKIKNLLLQECNVIYKTNLSVKDYNEVINLWLKYKKENKLYLLDADKNIIKDIFEFHKKDIDHVILYYSKELLECLIMCKINNKYKNIQMPCYDNIVNYKKSFIAVYC